uniref:Capsid protein n=1 Tax=viral metagenome TaxID=1070528 RepID=A0A6M3LZJ9_9ZZZZ
MANPALSNLINYPKIAKIVADSWINAAALIRTGVIKRNPFSNQGTYEYTLRERVFQDATGAATDVGDPIPNTAKVQYEVKFPKLFRQFSYEESVLLQKIEVKDAVMETVSTVNGIRDAGTQAVDNSLYNILVGVGAAMDSNQSGTASATVALTDFTATMAKLGERGLDLNGGAMVANSQVYWTLLGLGMATASNNTMGDVNKNGMVIMGKLPNELLGLSFIMTDKLTAAATNKYYVYMAGRESLYLYGTEAPELYAGDKFGDRILSTVINGNVSYGAGFKNVTYGGSFGLKVLDTELATSANWTLAAADQKLVPIARAYVSIA